VYLELEKVEKHALNQTIKSKKRGLNKTSNGFKFLKQDYFSTFLQKKKKKETYYYKIKNVVLLLITRIELPFGICIKCELRQSCRSDLVSKGLS